MQQQIAMKQTEIQERQTAVAEQKAMTDAEIAAAKIELDAEGAVQPRNPV